MERPHTDPSATLVRRFELANLRVQLRLVEHVLEELDEFDKLWDRFVLGLRKIIKPSEEKGLPLSDPQLDDVLREVDAIRLDLASRQHIAVPDYRDPLAKFLRTGIRTFSNELWSLIGESFTQKDGTLLVPIDEEGESIYKVSLKNFEINVAEAGAEIARRRRVLKEDVRKLTIMLEEAERAHAEAHRLELERVQATALSHQAWTKFRESTLGKIVWWLGEEPLRKWLLGVLGVIVLGLIPPIRHGLGAFLQWVLSRF